MSDKCANCDCADKTQCTKNGNSYGVIMVDATESRREEHMFAAAENGGCNCGSNCTCTDCKCGK